jgi:5-formyltetrahydrofolate cyclo-ligase
VQAAKRDLRGRMRELRRSIAADPADRLARSARIWAAVVERVELHPGTRVMLFESLPTEPETAGWVEWCRRHDVAVFVPVVDGRDLRVEPGDLDPTLLDVVIVPGLAFADGGRRLGQGGGHYDRFLRKLHPDCVTIGVAFAEQLVDDLPHEDHDVRVGAVVTDA